MPETTERDLGSAERLNRGCFCVTLDRDKLASALDREVGITGFAEGLSTSHPTLFSNVPVFVPTSLVEQMLKIVQTIEAVAGSAGYVDAALSHAPSIAKVDFGPVGAFMGYDFHLTPDGPKLIEINSNAGGAFLNATLAEAQRACCTEVEALLAFQPSPAAFTTAVGRMFVDEWVRQRGGGRPRLIAIVDDEPEQQHLYPEFQMAKSLLESTGFKAVNANAADLTSNADGLSIDGRRIDLVYNRLVDFALEEPRHAALRAAYLSGSVVVTPNPHVHALLADKRNLSLLSDPGRLAGWGLSADQTRTLAAGLLNTVVVTADNADALWRRRREFFFKTARGHGSKAAYRGDKLTRKVWSEIISGHYVAQSFAPPSVRGVATGDERVELKVDVRLYTYAGGLVLAAARLYQGQTTNMRTPGGGFAPVLAVEGDEAKGVK